MICNEDTLFLLKVFVQDMSLLEGMLDDIGNHIFMKRIDYIEHVFTVAYTSLWISIREVLGNAIKFHKAIVEVFDTELIISGYLNSSDISIQKDLTMGV